MAAFDDASHICREVQGELCSYPNYCDRRGCLRLPLPEEDNDMDRNA